MLHRGYITICLIVLAIIGASKDASQVPNQEILLQFKEAVVSPSEANKAIAQIEHRLNSVGISNVQVVDAGDGLLKILYYSDVDSAKIARLIGAEEELAITLASIPFRSTSDPENNDSTPSYELNVVELQSDLDAPWHLNGESLHYANTKFRGDHSVVYASGMLPELDGVPASWIPSETNVAIDSLRHKNLKSLLPEPRAGPFSEGIEAIS